MSGTFGRCNVEYCEKTTRNGKRFCVDHLEFASVTVDNLAAKLAEREAEIRRVLEAGQDGWRFVDLGGSVAGDIVGSVKTHGTQLVKHIGRHVGLKGCVVQHYVKALVSSGVLSLRQASATDGNREDAVTLKS